MKRILSVFGTRPEAIKMAPVVKALEAADDFESIVAVTAQHREMLDQVLDIFEIQPDYDLNIMKAGQTLSDITARVLKGMQEIIIETKPDMVLVHGDTSTTFAAALAAFHERVKVGHVEAGLRTFDKWSPFPEEMNRSLTGRIADIHFAPTESNVQNLLNEGIPADKIHMTGNTVIDALHSVLEEGYVFDVEELNHIEYDQKRVIFMTAHRRENQGEPMHNIFRAVRRIADDFSDVEIVFPMHLNPVVREIALTHLDQHDRIHLIEPLDYKPFANMMAKCHFMLTDSGGIQEEAPSLGKPVLVLRTETERPEAVEAGTVQMAGVVEEDIYSQAAELLTDQAKYEAMEKAANPYGVGRGSINTLNAIRTFL